MKYFIEINCSGQKKNFWGVINFLSLLPGEIIFAGIFWFWDRRCFNSISSLSDFLQLQVYFLCSAPPSRAFQLSEHTKISKMKVAPRIGIVREHEHQEAAPFSMYSKNRRTRAPPQTLPISVTVSRFLGHTNLLRRFVVGHLRRMTSWFKYFVCRDIGTQ